MQSQEDELREAGIELVAISADSTEDLKEKMRPKGIAFPLLADPELAAIDAYGLRHVGGNPFGGDISRPAVFLIDEEGRIVEKMLTENWRVRPTPEMIREKFSGEE